MSEKSKLFICPKALTSKDRIRRVCKEEYCKHLKPHKYLAGQCKLFCLVVNSFCDCVEIEPPTGGAE